MNPKTFQKHLDAIQSGTVTESFTRAIKRALNDDRLTEEQEAALWAAIEAHTPVIAAEQARKGYAWLQKVTYRPSDGKPRKDCPLGYREREILAGFSHFEHAGFVDVSRPYHRPYSEPVYRVVALDGSAFEYHYGSWQGNSVLTVVA